MTSDAFESAGKAELSQLAKRTDMEATLGVLAEHVEKSSRLANLAGHAAEDHGFVELADNLYAYASRLSNMAGIFQNAGHNDLDFRCNMIEDKVLHFARASLHIATKPCQIADSQLYAVETDVTPKMALDWLDKFNGKNRNPRQSTVEKHCRDMEAGRWIVSHQGIAFDTKQQLTSGQHRLFAVVRSQTEIRSLVFLNCPLAERNVIDQTTTRGVKDVALLGHDEAMSGRMISTARGMAYGLEISGGMTAQETFAFIDAHRESIEFVLKQIVRPISGITSAQVLGAICRAYYSMNKRKLTEFIEVLTGGFSLKEEHRPIILLRNWLLENKDGMGGRKGRRAAYGKTTAALEAFKSGDIPDRLKVSDGEIFQIGESAA